MTRSRWAWPVCILALTAIPVAAADVRIGAYRDPPSEGVRNAYRVYLDGVKGGLMASNAWAKNHGRQAFCMPENHVLTTEDAEDMMLKSAQKRAAKDDTFVASLLLSGLRDAFPCEPTGDVTPKP